MLRKFENENKNQNKKNLRLKIYGKIRNGRLKLEPSVLIKKCSFSQSLDILSFFSVISLRLFVNYAEILKV